MKTRKIFIILILALGLMAYPAGVSVAGANWPEQDKLRASDGAADDNFGRSVSISGDFSIVGAHLSDSSGSDSGSAYIYKQDGGSWTQQSKLVASDAAVGDEFGCSVSISGDYAIVGAHLDDHLLHGINCGSAYMFKWDGMTWNQQTKVLASDAADGEEFGWAVSISNDYCIIGARYDNENGTQSGSAYIFKRDGSTWSQQAKLVALDGTAYDYFGRAVSISNNYAIIGAPGDDDMASAAGAAYIFAPNDIDPNNWDQQAKLTVPDGIVNDKFGYSVSISGDYALVGMFQDDDKGTDSGSAYVFHFDGANWLQQTKLRASDGAAGDHFGLCVSIRDSRAIVGAYSDDDNGSDSGSAYVFKYDGAFWLQQDKLTASDGAGGDKFGRCVSLSDEHCLVGTHLDDDNGSDSGSAYIFQRDGTGWIQQLKRDASDGAAGDEFGFSVSINRDDVVVGARSDDNKGAAYIFKYDEGNWIEQDKLLASDGAANDRFGCSVSINGSGAIVGAWGNEAAYVFTCSGSNWAQQAKLTASGGAAEDYFGICVSISGDYAVVGAYFDDSKGSAYVFKRSGTIWNQQAKLTASDGVADDNFGWSVCIDRDYVIVGARNDDSGTGSAYIFKRNDTTWSQQDKLTALDGMPNDHFGYAVSIHNNYAVVGAEGDDTYTGSAYIFTPNDIDPDNWDQCAKLTASDGAAMDKFGASVSICDDYAIAGAFNADGKETSSGSAYIFIRDDIGWIEQNKLAASAGAAGDYFGRSVSISMYGAIVGAHWDDDKGNNSGSVYMFERICPAADLSGDCGVNLYDFAILANQWLEFD